MQDKVILAVTSSSLTDVTKTECTTLTLGGQAWATVIIHWKYLLLSLIY